MSQTSIRLVRTPDIDKVISYLRSKYTFLSDAEIIKLALSEKYQKDVAENTEEEKKLRAAYQHAMSEGRKIGIKLMQDKGLESETVTEQEFYDHFLDRHKDHD